MVIYIHGFGGSGEGSKAKAFRDYFRSVGIDFIAPSLSYVPELAIKTLEELIESYKKEIYLIGSSLGGYYATYLSSKKEVKRVVLINPSVNPSETLKRAIGNTPNFYDESFFSWNMKHIEMLEQYKVEDVKDRYKDSFMLLVQKGDELLDYKESVNKYKGCKQIIEDGGSHSFDGIERHFETIREFFNLEGQSDVSRKMDIKTATIYNKIKQYAQARKEFNEAKDNYPEYLSGNDNIVGIAGEFWAKIFLEQQGKEAQSSSADGNQSEKWVDFTIKSSKGKDEFISVKTIFESRDNNSGYIKCDKELIKRGILSVIIIKLDDDLKPEELLYIEDIVNNLKNGKREYQENFKNSKLRFKYYKNGFDDVFSNRIYKFENGQFVLKK